MKLLGPYAALGDPKPLTARLDFYFQSMTARRSGIRAVRSTPTCGHRKDSSFRTRTAISKSSRSDGSCLPVHNRQVRAPWSDGVAVLPRHDARDLRNVTEVVRDPGGQ